MSVLPECYGIIPARYQSTRFEGKPIKSRFEGKPMFWHVYKRACQCRELKKVVLATDHEMIKSEAKDLDVQVVMTRPDHPSGTDRVLEAAQQIQVPDDDIVINIQGDEPLLEPSLLTELIQPFSDPKIEVTTPVRKIKITNNEKEIQDTDRVKVVFTNTNKALYFSRLPVPYNRDEQQEEYYMHIGIYAFRMKTLKKFVQLKPSKLELTEKLEQLRLLENDIPIHIVETEYESISVDRPEDVLIVEERLKSV